MKKLPFIAFLVAFVVLAVLVSLSAPAFAQGPASLKEGIELYNQESYEEAITVLTRARQEDPSSADAAFFLGMAFRQSNDVQSAYKQLEEAVGLKPLSDNAILQFIETATLLDKFDVAGKWIGIAEENKVYPARVAFLKGTALAKQGKFEEAIAAFENCKKLDPAYTQTADFQIGVCYMNQRKFAAARDRFQSAVTQDPLSDMASYARRYQESAEHMRYIERPLRLTIGVTGQYDSNYRLLIEPYRASDAQSQALMAYVDSQERRSLAMQNMVRLDFVPVLPAPFVFNAGYAVMNTLHEKYSTSNDTFSNSFTLAPGVNFDNYAINLVGNYTHNLKRNPSYKRYSESATIGPLFRYLLDKNHIIEASALYVKKNFFYPDTLVLPNPENEDQSARGLDSYLGWIWFYKERGLLNLRVGYTRDNADGRHFENQGYRFTANVIHPLTDTLRLQLGGEIYLQDYKNENIYYNNTLRKDRSYTGSVGLTWSVHKYVDLIAQYLYTRVNSNIYAYDYKRDICSLGVELKF